MRIYFFSFNYSSSIFSALLSVFLFIYSNSKIAFILLVFLLVYKERYGLLRDAVAAMIKRSLLFSILALLEKDVFDFNFDCSQIL